MADTVPTWGYRQGESRIFELPAANPVLPKGWYDSPAKVPDGDPGQGGEPAALASHPPPQASPPLPSIEEMEAFTYANLAEENRKLKERVAELEAWIAGAVPAEEPHPENPKEREPELPPVPGAEPSMREILDKADPAPPPDEIEVLRGRARELGIEVDQRWGAKRLHREIAYVLEDKQ
jgi:hypothetical protein